MQQRKLGSHGPLASAQGLGCMGLSIAYGEPDDEESVATIRRALEISQAHACVLEMILKDTHTCEFHPERFDIWTQVAREEIRALGWV